MSDFESIKKYYSGKKIFLTGHTGFKGAWMLAILHHLGAKIHGYSLEAESNSLYRAINGNHLCESTIADIRDYDLLHQSISNFKPDVIFHLAAQSLVLPSYESPLYTFEVNTMGTANVLEAGRRLDHHCQIVVITTDKVYRNIDSDKAFLENDPLGGHDPYSGSKAAAELITDSYIRSFYKKEQSNVKVCAARAGNVIGGGDWAVHRIIPDIVTAIYENKPIIIRNPNSVRPWQHVIDPIFGYLVLASRMKNSSLPNAFNFGPDYNERVTVLELTKKAIEIWGKGTYEIDKNANSLHESNQLLLNSCKANDILNWHPMLSQMESIDWTIKWYKKVMIENQLPLEALNQQIQSYFNLLES